jgi:hypothetical protein
MGVWERIVGDLFARLDGPLHFRFIVQPLMAIIFAVIDGVKDAKAGKSAYFLGLAFNSGVSQGDGEGRLEVRRQGFYRRDHS